MYYFNILELLEKGSLTKSQMMIKHTEVYGYCNRTTLGKVLKKLVSLEKIKVTKKTGEHRCGVVYIYSLNK